MSLPDDRKSKLLAQLLLADGASLDMVPLWLKSELTDPDADAHTVTLWHSFWDQEGIPAGPFAERASAWLGSLGHTENTLQEQWASYWAAP